MISSFRITSLQKRQLLTFGVAWFAYASTYLLRKPLGVIKTELQYEFLFTETQLGWLDAALLLPYATMQMVLGPLGDKYGPRKTLSVCLILAGLSVITFGLFSHFFVFFLLLFLTGTAQAITWPNSVKALGSWYPPQTRNSVMGLFGTCAFVGGIAGTSLAVFLQGHYFSWRYVFLTPSIVVILMGFVVRFLLYSPEELSITIPGAPSEESTALVTKMPKPKWMELWKIPAVPEIAGTMFCLKIVRYCIFMWFPMFLQEKNHWPVELAGMMSTFFEVGGIIGSILSGIVIDRYFKGFPLAGITLSVAFSTVALLVFFLTTQSGVVLINAVCLAVTGAFNCGPDTMLGSSIPLELGAATGAGVAVIALVNGFGSVGTFLEGPILGMIIQRFQWDGMSVSLVILSSIGTLLCWRASRIHARSTSVAKGADTATVA